MNKSARIGVWENNHFKGVIIFGLGASPSLGKRFGLGIFECCELTRIALKDHAFPVSRLISVAITKLRAWSPGVKLIVSFADPQHGHHGGIYQAANWYYLGKTAPSTMIRCPDGKLADERRFNGHGHNKMKQIPAGSIRIRTPGKHRYAFPLDAEMRKKLSAMAKPYPKRPKQATVGSTDMRRGSADPDAPI